MEKYEVGSLSISDIKVIWDEEECISCDKCIKLYEHMSSHIKYRPFGVRE